MFAVQQVRGGQRIGKVWIFTSRNLAQQSIIKTYETPAPDSLMQTTFDVKPALVQVSTNYTGTLYFAISEVIPSDEIIHLY